MTWQACTCKSTRPSLTEEMIMNYSALPPSLKGWRRYRIEYGFECSCPEETIYLPPWVDADRIEDILNEPHPNSRESFGDME